MVALTTTISTPTNFVEYAKSIDENDPTRTFVENMLETSDVMRAIPILPAERGKRAYMDIATLPTVGFRGLNEAANQGLGSFNLREEDTFFIDDYIYADRAMLDRLGPEGKYKQEKLKSVALGQFFSQNVIKSDNSSNARTPNGIQVRCLDSTAITGNLINNSAASGGAALSLANLDQLYWRVNKPTHWIMPRGLMPQWDTAARNNTLVNQTVGYSEDDVGRRIIKFKGLPILFGYEPDDSPDLLPFPGRRLLRHRADRTAGDGGRPGPRHALRFHAYQVGLRLRARAPEGGRAPHLGQQPGSDRGIGDL